MVLMSTKGFVVVAQNNNTVDYIKQAYALALSIRYSQKVEQSISIITNDTIPLQYRAIFDKIISIPGEDMAVNANWKVENRWKIYQATPYDETIVLDTDMLLLEDIDAWWRYCDKYELHFCSRIKNYKAETIIDTYHRKTFIANNLTNPYFALHYFKKSTIAYNFYKVLEFVTKNWQQCHSIMAPVHPQTWLSMDLATAIAIEIMGLQDTALSKNSPMEFIHMKPGIQGWTSVPTSWQDAVSHVLTNKGELIVSNIKQHKIFHYVEKNFITDDMLVTLRALVNDN